MELDSFTYFLQHLGLVSLDITEQRPSSLELFDFLSEVSNILQKIGFVSRSPLRPPSKFLGQALDPVNDQAI